jgi:protein-S-isoprenylcysteine O-methyltransferase Ste14
MPIFPKPYADRVARLRVPFGFVLVAVFAWFSRPAWSSLAIGIPVSVCGLALRAWAAGHLAKNAQLAQSGPYAWVRNPLYIGTLTVAAGLVLASRSVGLGVLFAAVFGLVYLPVIQLEEQHLRSLFPEYADYARRVNALFPWPRSSSGTPFRLRLYLKNREYEALLGFFAGVAWLVWKAHSTGK